MSRKLPLVGSNQFIKFIQHYGYERATQKGSHITFRKKGSRKIVVVANQKQLTRVVTNGNLKTLEKVGITRQDYINFFKPKKAQKFRP